MWHLRAFPSAPITEILQLAVEDHRPAHRTDHPLMCRSTLSHLRHRVFVRALTTRHTQSSFKTKPQSAQRHP